MKLIYQNGPYRVYEVIVSDGVEYHIYGDSKTPRRFMSLGLAMQNVRAL